MNTYFDEIKVSGPKAIRLSALEAASPLYTWLITSSSLEEILEQESLPYIFESS